MDTVKNYWGLLSSNAKTSIVCAGLGFFLSFSELAESSIGGQYDCYYYDYGKILLGAAAIIFAVLAIFGVLRQQTPKPNERTVNIVVAAVVIAVAMYHLVVGLGVVNSPCLA